MHWVDENTIAFAGASAAQEKSPTDHPHLARFGVLDTRNGSISWGGAVSSVLCVNGERVAYSRVVASNAVANEHPRFWIVEGRLGAMREYEVQRADIGPGSTTFDLEYSCQPMANLPEPPTAAKVSPLKRLRPEHGFAELGVKNERGLTMVYPKAIFSPNRSYDRVPVTGLLSQDIRPSWPYFHFKNAYWLAPVERVSPAKPPGSFKAWWLYPNGRVEVAAEVDLIRTFDGTRSWLPVVPTRAGFLTFEERTRRTARGNIGAAGLYRFVPSGRPILIAAGSTGAWAVSPSGCKVAVGIDPRADDHGLSRYILSVVEMCNTPK